MMKSLWFLKLDMTFVGDDNDVAETSHSTQAEILSDYVKQTHPFVNINKIYLDAYEQENSLVDSVVRW